MDDNNTTIICVSLLIAAIIVFIVTMTSWSIQTRQMGYENYQKETANMTPEQKCPYACIRIMEHGFTETYQACLTQCKNDKED